MEMNIAVTNLESRRMGEEVTVQIEISSGENRETVRFTISSKMLFEIGNIGPGNLPYSLTREDYDRIEYGASLWEAVKKGIDLISYSDNTKAVLKRKLIMRGFGRELAADAVDYIESIGLINEKRILSKTVENLAKTKLYGPARIKAELYKKGISGDIMREELEELLGEYEFEENIEKLVDKRFDFSKYNDRKYRESFLASMYRMGYSASETNGAIKKLYQE